MPGRERYAIDVSPLAARQLAYLRDAWGIDFTERAFETLRLDPTPHRTRRILRLENGRLRMACGPWRLYYTVEGLQVRVESVGGGVADPLRVGDSDRDALVAFAERSFQNAEE